MLNKATCAQSYSKWRYHIFRRLAEDALNEGEHGGHLIFLHPKSLHPLQRRNVHQILPRASSTTQSKSQHVDQSQLINTNDEAAKPRVATESSGVRIIRKVVLKDGSEETGVGENTEALQGNDRAASKKSVHWKPTSPAGRQDLQGLAESLRSLSESLEAQAPSTSRAERDNEPSESWYDSGLRFTDYELPTSPLERHMEKKTWTPKRQPTQEEKERLASNPWATMLAGPMRQDAATKARLPTALLLDFGHIENPDDHQIYMMPEDIADLQAFNDRLQKGQRNAAMTRGIKGKDGNMLQILPYRLVLEYLTDSFMVWSTKDKEAQTKTGAVMRKLFPARWGEQSQKYDAYRNASKEYWDLREKQKLLDDDMFKRPEPQFEGGRTKWDPAIVERIPNIMRQRVLLALNHVAKKQNRPKGQEIRSFYCLPWPEKHSLDAADFSLPPSYLPGQTFWNDMGDIEAPDAITGTGSRQGPRDDPRPPIAVKPAEIRQGQEKAHTNSKDDPEVWLPGSFILHLGSPTTALSALPYQLPASISNMSDPTFEHSKYIPPMISVADYRLPVFNLPAMLGPKLERVLHRVLGNHRSFKSVALTQPENVRSASTGHIIVVKSVAPASHFLAQELWQLWRYLGGRDCLLGHLTSEELEKADSETDADVRNLRSGFRERMLKSKTSYRGLSDRAWEHLHELLGLNKPKTEVEESKADESVRSVDDRWTR